MLILFHAEKKRLCPYDLYNMPSYIVGETELEASKADRTLAHFKYACVGYSVFLDRKDTPADPHNKQAELPFCVGLEALYLHSYLFFLVSLICKTRAMKYCMTKNLQAILMLQLLLIKVKVLFVIFRLMVQKPHIYICRFKRNAALVASGVARNVNSCTLFQLL
ncbi:hypothetical protein ACFX2G_035014 [Malus domestica]